MQSVSARPVSYNTMENYKVQSPVLFIVFNRPDTTGKVFERIREVKPSRLYIAADGPRASRPADEVNCTEVRQIVQQVDWDCEVKTLFSDVNKGCKIAVSDAITWFFDNEPEGIILEDDCFPAISFFSFCDQMLERYRNDFNIFSITGTNKLKGQRWTDADYYFSRYANIWGWASWARVWKGYDRTMSRFEEHEVEKVMARVYDDRFFIEDYVNIFKKLKAGEIDTWDYQFNFLGFFTEGLTITPNVNLITNIGFGEGATHTFDTVNPFAAMPIGELTEPLKHPASTVPVMGADAVYLRVEHDLDARWARYMKRTKRIKRWLKRTFLGK